MFHAGAEKPLADALSARRLRYHDVLQVEAAAFPSGVAFVAEGHTEDGVVSCPLLVVSCRLFVVGCQMFVASCQMLVVRAASGATTANWQLTTINRPLGHPAEPHRFLAKSVLEHLRFRYDYGGGFLLEDGQLLHQGQHAGHVAGFGGADGDVHALTVISAILW